MRNQPEEALGPEVVDPGVRGLGSRDDVLFAFVVEMAVAQGGSPDWRVRGRGKFRPRVSDLNVVRGANEHGTARRVCRRIWLTRCVPQWDAAVKRDRKLG